MNSLFIHFIPYTCIQTWNKGLQIHSHTEQICNSNNSMRFARCTTSDMAQNFPVDRVSCKFKFNKHTTNCVCARVCVCVFVCGIIYRNAYGAHMKYAALNWIEKSRRCNRMSLARELKSDYFRVAPYWMTCETEHMYKRERIQCENSLSNIMCHAMQAQLKTKTKTHYTQH